MRDHQQFVKLQNHYSDWITLNHGVRQGTVLEPIILILYVNDFKNQINRNMNLVQFSDDTSILCRGHSIKDLRTSMLETLKKIHEYLNEKKLALMLIKRNSLSLGKRIIKKKLFIEKKQYS